jgi:hypothetical protein
MVASGVAVEVAVFAVVAPVAFGAGPVPASTGGAVAAVVDDVVAIAAAAIASGAFALAGVVCGLAGPVATGISAAIGFCVVVCVSAGFAASFASPAWLPSEEALSDDLLSELFGVFDFALLLFGGALLSALAADVLLAAGGLEFAESSERLGGGWSGPCALRAGLLSEA